MYKDLDEQSLAIICSEGNKMAEEELYRRYAARVYTLCRRYVGDNDEAMDLMQDSFIQAFNKIQTFRYKGSGSLYGWLSRIAINKAINHIKRQRWRTISLNSRVHDTVLEPTAEEIELIPQEKLLELISRLPGMQKTVFNLYCIDGYSHKEISDMLGISEKGSAGILAKARKQLKEKVRYYLNGQDK